MTQPVQEPSQGRINQGVAFKQRQLFRRPLPVVDEIQVEYAYVYRASNYSVSAGASAILPWVSFDTTDTTVFATDTSPPGWPGNNTTLDTYVLTNASGIFVAEAYVEWANGTYDRYSIIESSADGQHGVTGANAGTGAVPGGSDWTADILTSFMAQPDKNIAVRVFNGDASARNVTQAHMKVTMFKGTFVQDYETIY